MVTQCDRRMGPRPLLCVRRWPRTFTFQVLQNTFQTFCFVTCPRGSRCHFYLAVPGEVLGVAQYTHTPGDMRCRVRSALDQNKHMPNVILWNAISTSGSAPAHVCVFAPGRAYPFLNLCYRLHVGYYVFAILWNPKALPCST